ncbi:DsrE family protein [Roseicella aerolata]|uniref:DsrE family protein n=1 Tax=Roseicella aerolata TaxID=2883479 RepID=A0A9X1IFG7_9PROT|nr:DsrE family protein [Roseicella aerolata]MCB4823729.1 DsrE family protein [Roseicella aerolata]
MRARRALLAMLAAMPLAAAGVRETPLAEPKPTVEAPRRIVVSVSEADPARANAVFSNLINIQGFYGQDLVEILVVAYGPGLRHLLREESQVAERVASLQAYGIEFVACGATLDTLGLAPEAVLEGVQVVQNGLPEVVERQLMGWIHLRP